jgi:hypothetical protein
MTTCRCSICASRMARGEPPFEGVSVSSTAHVTAAEMPTAEQRREVREQEKWAREPPRSSPPPPVTRATIRAEIKKLADDTLAAAIGEALGTTARSIEARCEQRCNALQAEITALRAEIKGVRYAGQWSEGKTFRAGELVTCGGIWHCDKDTKSKPGISDHWTLALPRGRDGKDGRDGAPAPAEPPAQRQTRSHR